MIISRLVFPVALATCFLFGAVSVAAQEAPKVANVLSFEGPTPKILEFGKRAVEIGAKYDTTGTTRWWVSGLSGTNTGRLVAVIEYPNSVSMAQSRSKIAASPEWQKFTADFQAAGLKVISSSEIIEVTPYARTEEPRRLLRDRLASPRHVAHDTRRLASRAEIPMGEGETPMRRLTLLLFLCLVWSAAQASAEVMHYSKCKLNEGKTIADVQAWVDTWRPLAKANGIDYRVRLLVPHADNDLGADEFFIEGGSSTLTSHAAAWTWWYSNADAAKSNAKLTAAASCDTGAIYRSTD